MRQTWVEINLQSIKANLKIVQNIVGSEVSVLAVVKADAYGHGAVKVSNALIEAGVDVLGVATVEEGMELREAGINLPILLLGAICEDEIKDIFGNDLTPTVYHLPTFIQLSDAAKMLNIDLKFHLKLDTGMSRLGLKDKEFELCFDRLLKSGITDIEGIFTHLACADEEDESFTVKQIDKFNELLGKFNSKGIKPEYTHMANSAAIQKYSRSHGNMVRPGIMLYGSGSYNGTELNRVMTLKSRIIQIKSHKKGVPISYGGTFVTERDSRIATVPVGYADGYMRKLSNKAFVSISGKITPVVGSVCMDFIMVDVTEINDVKIGDQVILFGDDNVSIEDVAGWAETVPYEIMTVLGKRVPRVFV